MSGEKPCLLSTFLVISARSCSSSKPLVPIFSVPLPVLLALPLVGQVDEPPVLVVELPQPARMADHRSTMVSSVRRRVMLFSERPRLEGTTRTRRGRATNLPEGPER